MKLNKTLTALIVVLFAAVSCTDFVQDVEEPINLVSEENLLTEDQVPFLLDGVAGRFHITHDALSVIAEGLSDAWEFESSVVTDATFPTFGEIDRGEIFFDNNSVDGPFTNLGQARFLADDMLEKIEAIDFEDASLEQEAKHVANLYAGLTRAAYASYFGINETEGGATINNSEFIPSDELYARAKSYLETALSNAPTAYEEKVVNSLIGRIHIYQNEFAEAVPYLEAGMEEGDAPFQSVHSLESQNNYFAQAGRSRTQFSVDRRFGEYIAEDPAEANRLDIEEVEDEDELTADAIENGTTFWRSTLEGADNLNIISWQENNLMLAEAALEGEGSGDPLELVNAVRASHEIDPLDSIDIDVLLEEREKELLHTGNRLIDQRRRDEWHLSDGTWQYFPLTQSERNNNPNSDNW